MNFCRTGHSDVRLGLHVGDRCLDLVAAHEARKFELQHGLNLEDVILSEPGLRPLEDKLAETDLETLGRFMLPMTDVRPRPPVFHPQKIIGVGLNYHDHAEEVGMDKPSEPMLFAMFSNAIIGHNDAIEIPEMSTQVDYEAELGVVIGRRGRHIAVDDAVDYIAGYTILNDVSARDLQFSDRQWIRGKTFDTFAPIGPCLVSPRILGNGSGLDIQLRLNGKTMQKSNTSNLIFNVPELVAYSSQIMTLEPGDMFATGTPGGVGFARKPPVFLKSGNEIEIEIEGIGKLRNTVA